MVRIAVDDFKTKYKINDLQDILFNYHNGNEISDKDRDQLYAYWEQIGAEPGNARWERDIRTYRRDYA